jgi:hypothetical protein
MLVCLKVSLLATYMYILACVEQSKSGCCLHATCAYCASVSRSLKCNHQRGHATLDGNTDFSPYSLQVLWWTGHEQVAINFAESSSHSFISNARVARKGTALQTFNSIFTRVAEHGWTKRRNLDHLDHRDFRWPPLWNLTLCASRQSFSWLRLRTPMPGLSQNVSKLPRWELSLYE